MSLVIYYGFYALKDLTCYTEWSKSEREKQMSYINTYVESRKNVLMNLFSGQD